LVDLATDLSPLGVERAVNDADKRGLIDPGTLRSRLDCYAGEPGVQVLRGVLDKQTFRLSDSNLEVFFRRIAKAAALPPPLTKQVVNGYEVDFYWPRLGLVVETDGLRYHRTPSTQARDAERDRAHVLAGMTPLRFTHYEIRYRPASVRRQLEDVLALLRARNQD
jgi:very-short-patch-repair endonuclease